MPHRIDTAATEILKTNVPVLFLDTCALLDLLRLPIRGDISSIAASIRLAQRRSASPRGLQVVLASLVLKEWDDNVVKVREEFIGKVSRVDEQLKRLHDICGMIGITVQNPRQHYEAKTMVDKLLKIAVQLKDAALILADDDGCEKRALQRAVRGVRPSQKGQIKDCVIIEHYLELGRHLRNEKFGCKCVFVSSNTADFCEEGGGIHLDLEQDFLNAGLEFTTHLSWAEARI